MGKSEAQSAVPLEFLVDAPAECARIEHLGQMIWLEMRPAVPHGASRGPGANC